MNGHKVVPCDEHIITFKPHMSAGGPSDGAKNAGREGRRANEDTRPFRTTHADNGWRPGAGVVTEHFVPCSVLPKGEGRSPRSVVTERELFSGHAVRHERTGHHVDGEPLRLWQSLKRKPGQGAHVARRARGVEVAWSIEPNGPLTLVVDSPVNRLTLLRTDDEGIEEEIGFRLGWYSIAEVPQ